MERRRKFSRAPCEMADQNAGNIKQQIDYRPSHRFHNNTSLATKSCRCLQVYSSILNGKKIKSRAPKVVLRARVVSGMNAKIT
jgi:hypothetical protein